MTKKVAVIGYAFRFPGSTSQDYWQGLLDGRDLVTEVDASRWEKSSFLHPNKSHPGTSYSFAAGSIGDISKFDASFFGISPREAALMDPQQRLLLEMTWEALENSGVKPSTLKGSRCGVYIGIASADYSFRLADDLGAVDASVATGNTASIAANRISYVFDLRGPSLAIDTACSASLVAFHQACQSILSGETVQVLTGGVSLHAHPYGFVSFSKASMLSRRGRCNVFDADGDGYVRSEGGGIFFLKDYDAAVADGNQILAVVTNSAVNTDGRKSGLTVPSSAAQSDLLEEVYARANIEPDDIDYIEAHGTGTAVGDPIETHALGVAIGKRRREKHPLLIGSVKSNMGHLEAASGVAGLVKALHCVQHRVVPATIGIKTPNPNIHFDEWNIEVARANTPLKKSGKLIVGTNSFGFGGANAHVILESYDSPLGKAPRPTNIHDVPIVISGKSNAALKVAASEFSTFLKSKPQLPLYDIAFNTCFARDWHDHRAIVFAHSADAVIAALDNLASGMDKNGGYDQGVAVEVPIGPAFVYSGNGSQWFGMGKALLAEDVVFRNAIREVDAIFQRFADYSLEAELAGEGPTGTDQDRYQHTEFAQPALFALQVGITQMLRHRGISPTAVAGHSVGEVAAAWASGALSLTAAVEVIYHRSQLQGRTSGLGAMSAVLTDAKTASTLIDELILGDAVVLAGINSTRGVTVAGAEGALAAFEAALTSRAIPFKRLDLDYAFHSPAMDSIELDVLNALAKLRPSETNIPFFSTVTGELLDGRELRAAYWWHNIRLPVLFARAVKGMQDKGTNVFIEIGPHVVLRGYLNDAIKANTASDVSPGRVITTLTRNDGSPQRVWSAANQAIVAGCAVNWASLLPWRGRFVSLPNYPWQKEKHWHPVTSESGGLLARRKVHPLLGYRLVQHEFTWENVLDTKLYQVLADHVVGDAIVFPGSAYVELAIAAALQTYGGESVSIEELEIRSPLLLSDEHSKVVRVAIDSADGGFTVRAREHGSEEAWNMHAVGRILREPSRHAFEEDLLVLPARAPDFDAASHQRLTIAAGLRYGPAFSAILHGWVNRRTAIAVFAPPPSVSDEISHAHLHPALLDCTFQLIIQLLGEHPATREAMGSGLTFVPTRMERIAFRAPSAFAAVRPASARATLVRYTRQSIVAEFTIFDETGRAIASLHGVRFRSIRLQKSAADRVRFLQERAIPAPHVLSPIPNSPLLFEEVRAAMSETIRRCAVAGIHRRYIDEVDPLLDEVCSQFGIGALRSLSDTKIELTIDEIAKKSEGDVLVSPYLRHIINAAKNDGLLVDSEGGYRFSAPENGQPRPEEIWNSLVSDYPDCFEIVHEVGRVGYHLRTTLSKASDRGAPAREHAPRLSVVAHVLGAQGRQRIGETLRDLIATARTRLSDDQRLGIVEMGEAPPLFAADICAAIDFDFCDYRFITPSPASQQQAQRMQERFPLMKSSLISPDEASADLGTPRRAQLIFLSLDFTSLDRALHALDVAREQLAPGGAIVVVGVHPSRWMDFANGERADWWRHTGDGGFVSTQQSSRFWLQQLSKRGFGTPSEIDFSSDIKCGPYLLLAHANGTGARLVVSTGEPPASKSWLIVADPIGYSARLSSKVSARLREAGHSVTTVSAVDVVTLRHAIQQIQQETGRVDGVVQLFGLRPPEADSSPTAYLADQEERCFGARSLAIACDEAKVAMTCWIVTSGAMTNLLPHPARVENGTENAQVQAADSALWGWTRTLANESASLNVKLVDMPALRVKDDVTDALAKEFMQPDEESEIILGVGGARFVTRLAMVPHPTPVSVHATADSAGKSADSLAVTQPSKYASTQGGAGYRVKKSGSTVRLGFDFPGQLRNLRWESHASVSPQRDEIEVQVHATGLNFRDIMYALGLLSDEAIENGFAGPTLGLEFSGIVVAAGPDTSGFSPGDRVVGFGPSCFANRVITKSTALSHIPRNLSFEAAATIPSTFFTVYYSLLHLAQLEAGETVLIHGAAGGVGIAAIQIAKWRGAVIYATAGSDEKRDFLRLLGVEHIFDSRSLAFADDILAATDGSGVDVVLNSLAGEAINRNLRILKPFGRFIELGKRDYYENTKIGLRPFRNNISYFGVDADQLMSERPVLTRRLFGEMMRLFDEGILHPLPYHAFEAEDIVDAFRYMQQARQIGKIVITYHHEIVPSYFAPTVGAVDALTGIANPESAPRLILSGEATYLVTGGLTGFGLKTAQWLAAKGAMHLVLIGRRGGATEEASAALAALKAAGVSVLVAACDVTDETALAKLLSDVTGSMPPLRGIVHAAAVIEDSMIRNVTPEQLHRVLGPKILGTQYLDVLTRGMTLDFFVLFSSATTLFGNPGQGSYVAANSAMEAVAANRRRAGYGTTCVRWGAIDDVGFLAR
ncbi:MAG: SDR family NAD(P)-dependent oxidoreductase, partial [Usitatibacteraceae bacterium]